MSGQEQWEQENAREKLRKKLTQNVRENVQENLAENLRENLPENLPENWRENLPGNPRIMSMPPVRADIVVNNEVQLQNAILAAPNGTPYEIEIGSAFLIGTAGEVIVPDGKQIILTGATVTRDPIFEGYLFYVESGASLTLTNITVDGNKDNVTALDALIHLAANATLNIADGAVLRNNLNAANTAASAGGAVQAHGYVNMTGGEIIGNTNYVAGDTDGLGGGIFLTGTGVFTMSGGTIAGNYAYMGGGIYSNSTAPTAITITDGTIDGNEAYYFGGGIAIYGSQMLLRDATIENNTAWRGGGVETNGTVVTMEGGYIINNHAVTNTDIGPNAYSGGVDNGGTFNMIGGSISGNTSDAYGGAMYNLGTLNLSDGATMSDNYAAKNGGAIMNRGPITADHAIFSGNTAELEAGGIYMLSGEVNFTDSQFVGNVAGLNGGAFVVGAGHLTLSGTDMILANNRALSEDECNTGGAIRTEDYSILDIEPGVIFTGNYATHAFNMPLEGDQAVYDAHVHSPSLDPQYDYAYNNADINWCPHSDPTMQITYWRNEYPGDPTHMTYGSNLAEGDAIYYGEPMWEDGEYFAGWSLSPDDTCPNLQHPAPTVYHRSDFSNDTPPNLNVYAIWCEEPVYHEVTFDPNGGSAVPGQSVLDGQNAMFGLSTKAGCVLEGWYTHPSLDVRFDFNTPIYENIRLYAKWDCAGETGETPAAEAELARLEEILADLEAGDKCYNIGILTEYGYQLIEHDGQLYLRNQLVKQEYLAIVPLTIAEVEADIARLEGGE
jgi:hypothetical protein